jgi:transcriptional regulator with XRE-family HTH domain
MDSDSTVAPNGPLVRELRKQRGFRSQDDLAKQARISVRTLRAIEQSSPVLPQSLILVAVKLKAPYESLLMGATLDGDPHTSRSPAERSTIRLNMKIEVPETDYKSFTEAVRLADWLQSLVSLVAMRGRAIAPR